MCYSLSNLLIYLAVVLRKRRRRSKVLRQRRPGELQKWEFRKSPSSKVRKYLCATFLIKNDLVRLRTFCAEWKHKKVLILVCVLCRDTVVSGPADLQQSGGEVTVVCWAHRVNPPLSRTFTTSPPAGAARHRRRVASAGLLAAHSCTQRRWESC